MRNVILFFVLLSFLNSFATPPIVLKEKGGTYSARGKYLDLFYDTTDRYSIAEISAPAFSHNFKPNKVDIPRITSRHKNSSVWARFSVENRCKEATCWLIELYDFEIDEFEIYIPDGKGGFIVKKGGDNYPFAFREFYHKNFVFELPELPPDTPHTFYLRFHSETLVGIIAVIRNIQTFAGYATTEYYFLAIFYGLAMAMIVYNLFLFFTVRNLAYLYYVLYVLSIMIYILCHDGTGFEYLWPHLPALNKYIQTVACFAMLIFALLYSKSFLSIRQVSPLLDKILNYVIFARSAIFVVTLLFYPEIRHMLYLDILCLLVAYVAGFVAFRKGFTPARFYLLAFTFFFAGFFITSVDELGWLYSNLFTVYSLNFGLVAEMLLLSLALGDRIKTLVKEKDKAQREMIQQLLEKEHLKDKINKELEEKVSERTKALEEKNKELDMFVYKASHDIKGPLKSIIGLTKIGMKDVTDPIASGYFEHIQKSTARLDALLADLLQLTQVKEIVPENTPIDFKALVEEILSSFEHFPNYKAMKFDIRVNQKEAFISDRKLIYSIMQNLIENPIKYMNPQAKQHYLHIHIAAEKDKAVLKFKDNGLGIPAEYQSRIFDMFFKMDPQSAGTGLGLHIVKLSVQKLNGKLELKSEEGKGSEFVVQI